MCLFQIENDNKELHKVQMNKPEKGVGKVNKGNVMITEVNDVHTYDTDIIGTYSQSSGTMSYDSIKSMNDDSLNKIKLNSKYVSLFLH